MSFLALHRRNVLERIPISKKEILPGDIIDVNQSRQLQHDGVGQLQTRTGHGFLLVA